MFPMKAAYLADRGVLKIAGDSAREFLNGLLTSDIGALTAGAARFAGLLTPQGKLIVDCIVVETDQGGFLLDCPRALASTLATRLNFYRLRAKVTIEDLSATLGILVAWDGDGQTSLGLAYRDPRLDGLGIRIILPPELAPATAAELNATLVDAGDYEVHRIALGVPRGGVDFSYGDAFPHETDMDQLGGVDFNKGCYVGQEVVSRMEHRGTARTRIVPVTYEVAAPEPGTAIMAGDKAVGTMGSAAAGHGLAMLRLDRVAEAAGKPLTAGGIDLTVRRPDWARFDIPSPERAAE
jgi:folate-binding protein YgfZ